MPRPKRSRPETLGCPFHAGPSDPARKSLRSHASGQARSSGAGAAEHAAALDFALHPIVTIDDRGIILSASQSVRRVFGWTPAELVGRNVSILMPEPDRSAHDGYLQRYRQTGKTNILNRPRRFEAQRKDATTFPIELSVSRAEIPGQSSPMFVGIIRDLSEQAEAERGHEADRTRLQDLVTEQTQALQSAHLRLRMADRLASIGTLAAGLGHDMNNVLLPVRAHLNALRAGKAKGAAGGSKGAEPPLSTQQRSHLEAIRRSVEYLQQLADGLHFLAMDPEADADERAGGEATNLATWWGQAGPLLSRAVPRHVRVTASIPDGLPDVAAPAHRLTQAVLNLVVNAGEAIPVERKRREGRVRVWARIGDSPAPGAGWVQLAVTDNGKGMSDEVKRRAFEMFYTTKVRGLGTGLGLPLVYQVAVSCGGRVEIESEPGKGTSVVLVLPAASTVQKGRRLRAVVTTGDGRAAALAAQLLSAAGVDVVRGSDPAGADIWVVQPDARMERTARAWRKAHPHAALVLLVGGGGGAAPPARIPPWSSLGAVTIPSPVDFEYMRTVLGEALAGH